MLVDEFDYIAGRRAWREYFSNASFLEGRNISLRDDTAADDQAILHAIRTDELDDFREEMRMSTGKYAHSYDIDILLQGSLSNLLRRLTQASVYNLETSIAQSSGYDLCTAVMTIQAWFCYKNSYLLCHFS